MFAYIFVVFFNNLIFILINLTTKNNNIKKTNVIFEH